MFGITIDGGGIGGVGVSHALKQLSSQGLRRPDFLGGTSVGSIVACLIANGSTYEEVDQIMMSECSKIFAKPPLYMAWKYNALTTRYDGKGLEDVLRKYFGNTRMCDLRTPTFVVALDVKRGVPKVFDTGDTDLVWQACRASSAAPTFFPQFGDYVDGGLGFNNPTVVTMAGLVSRYAITHGDVRVLNLSSNGQTAGGEDTRGKTALQILVPLLNSTMRASEAGAAFVAKQVIGDRYLRIDPKLADFAIDGLSAIPMLRDAWGKEIFSRRAEIVQWLVDNGGLKQAT